MAIGSNALVSIQSGLNSASGKVQNLLGNPVATGVGGALVGGALVGTVVAATRSRKKSSRKARKVKRSKSRARKGRKKTRSYARTAGKAKDRSTKRIRMTKNGQPYIILKSGKARFIKKSSARASRKRKGGRY